MQRYAQSAKAKRIITESARASVAHEVDLIIADQMLESFKAKNLISQLYSLAMMSTQSTQSRMSSSFLSCSMRVWVGRLQV